MCLPRPWYLPPMPFCSDPVGPVILRVGMVCERRVGPQLVLTQYDPTCQGSGLTFFFFYSGAVVGHHKAFQESVLPLRPPSASRAVQISPTQHCAPGGQEAHLQS